MRFATVELDNQVRLNYAEEGDSTGEALLFLHRWPDSWYTFSQLLPFLPSDLWSLAIDQRGFGDSARPECCYFIEDFAKDAVAFLDAVKVEKATIVGHSFGTFVGRHMASRFPNASTAWS